MAICSAQYITTSFSDGIYYICLLTWTHISVSGSYDRDSSTGAGENVHLCGKQSEEDFRAEFYSEQH